MDVKEGVKNKIMLIENKCEIIKYVFENKSLEGHERITHKQEMLRDVPVLSR